MGTKRFDKIVVIDLEITCWESEEDRNGQPSEIIEIGVCVLDSDTLDISRKKSYIVKPKHSEVSKYCTQLTGHTPKSIKGGIPLKDTCNKLAKEYGTKNRVWASWGDGDRLHFITECGDKDATYPFGDAHLNISDLFTLATGSHTRTSVTNALKHFGMEFVGKQHNGADDAYNTAIILRHIFERIRKWN